MWASGFILQYQAVPGDGAALTQILKDALFAQGRVWGQGGWAKNQGYSEWVARSKQRRPRLP